MKKTIFYVFVIIVVLCSPWLIWQFNEYQREQEREKVLKGMREATAYYEAGNKARERIKKEAELADLKFKYLLLQVEELKQKMKTED